MDSTEKTNVVCDAYKVASVNFEPMLKDPDGNLKRLLRYTEEAAQHGARLIALPEMATTGYCWYDRAEVAPYVEPIPGRTTALFHSLARQYDCWIVVGMPEVDPATDLYYNSAVLIGPDGIVGVHRKTHPYISEPKWAKQGDLGHQVFSTPIGNIAMLICMDIHFIETARLQGLQNADVIVHISNWLAEKTPAPYWITRAFDNGCYVLESNRIGLERTVRFSGGSCLIRPDGTIQAYTDDDESILYGDVSLAAARRKDFQGSGHKFAERRPKAYMDLLSDPYLWNPLAFFGLYGHDPLPPGRISSVSVVQFKPETGNPAANRQKMEEHAARLADQGSSLIVFPELTLTGVPAPDQAERFAETVPGPSIDALLDVCMKHRVYLVVGMIEQDDGHLYNTAVLLGPDGIAGTYRKLHLDEHDRGWASPGNTGFVHANIPVGRVGLLIGHDALFPESGRALALQGVDLICCPSAVRLPVPYGLGETQAAHEDPIPRGYSTLHWHLWRVRGGENNCYLAFANQIGGDAGQVPYFGRSGVFGPDTFAFPRQECVLSASREECGTITVDTTNNPDSIYPVNVVRCKDLVRMRQPLWYDGIVAGDTIIQNYSG